MKTHIFNIGFSVLNGGAEDPTQDETQFDIEDAPIQDMLNDLLSLWNDFCDENGFSYTNKIEYIEEVWDE